MQSNSQNNTPKKKLLKPEEWLKSLPSKRVAVQVILFDTKGRILIVKPNYRDDWLLPGGIVEDNESPVEGMLRELKEELEYEPQYMLFAGVDYNAEKEHGNYDFIHVMFDGGIVEESDADAFVAEDGELDEIKFIEKDQLESHLNKQQLKRLNNYLNGIKTPQLFEEGESFSDASNAGQVFQLTGIVAAVLVVKDDKYMFVQELQAKAKDLWSFPAGRVDVGEEIEVTAIREAKEEAGIDVVLGDKVLTQHDSALWPIFHVFAVEQFSGEPTPGEGEINDIQWMTRDEVVEMGDKMRNMKLALGAIDNYEQR